MRTKIILRIVSLPALVAAFTCSIASFPYRLAISEETKHLKVGVVLPLTGVAALPAAHSKNALLLAKDQLERESGIPIELVIEDSRTDSKTAVAVYNKLASLDKVDAVIGDLWDFLAVPLIPLSRRYRLVTISPTLGDGAK